MFFTFQSYSWQRKCFKSMYSQEQLSRYAFFRQAFEKDRINYVLDPLTGLVSRQYILAFVRSLIEEGRPFTFGMLDLDNFKFINDTYGHHAGDGVLLSVAEGLAGYLDGYGVAGRFGGDELLWINLRDRAYSEKKEFLSALYNSGQVVRKNVQLKDYEPFVTGTIGCATYPDDAVDYEELFAMIDKTLYRGKRKGRNCYIIYVKEKHADIQIRQIARTGVYTSMRNLVRMFEMVPGLKNKLQSVAPVLIDELKVSDLYYVDQRRIMRGLRVQGIREDVGDIDRLMSDELFAANDLASVEARCPQFYSVLSRWEVESLMVVRVGMDNEPTDGYLVCAEPRNRRLWQEDECALMFFLAKLIAARIRVDGEPFLFV